jgi:hypothetical protein
MPDDPAHQPNRSTCQADFTYTMTVKAIKIEDTGKGVKSVAEDLEAVLRKIEDGTKAQSPVNVRVADGRKNALDQRSLSDNANCAPCAIPGQPKNATSFSDYREQLQTLQRATESLRGLA